MLNIGCHLSASKGYNAMGKQALSIGANTFQFFSRNPRGSKAKAFDKADADKLLAIMDENNFAQLLAHAPYTLNLCSHDAGLREFAIRVMKEDLNVLDNLPNNLYTFHPGSHTGQGIEVGLEQIIYGINEILYPEMKTTVLYELMSGKGSEVGSKFEEIATLINNTNLKEKVGVCLDTCHVYSAGYDIKNNLDGVIEEFDKTIGLKYLKAIHLNDSMMDFASNKDRHEKIGNGTLGLDTIVNVINHPSLKHLPFYLETPNELDGYGEEIALLKSKYII